MRFVTLDLEGTTVTVRLLDEEAPVTVERLWNQLPFEDRFTHSIWSGLLIHSNAHPKLDLDVSRYPLIEHPVARSSIPSRAAPESSTSRPAMEV